MIRKYQSGRSWRSWLYAKPTIFFLILLLVFLARSVYSTWRRERLAAAERQVVLEQLVALEVRQSQLAADLALLQTPRGVEEKIRQQFSVAKPDEEVITIVLSPTTTATSTPGLPWWQPFLDLFN